MEALADAINPKLKELGVDLSQVVERPYGWKHEISNFQQVLCIMPHKSTAIAAKPEDLDFTGLRGHPRAIFEHVQHIGYLSGDQDDKATLFYRFRPKNGGNPSHQFFSKDMIFYSVQTDTHKTGYWHELVNVSERPILVVIEVGEEPKLRA